MLTMICASLALAPQPQAGQRPDVNWNIPNGPAIPGVQHHVLRSKSMGRDVGYNVYLPASYQTSTKQYPVIYFLHGAGGNENSDAGGFSGLVKAQVDAKKIPEVICVFPNGGMSGYVDEPNTRIMGETLIVKELVPKIDAQFRTVSNRKGRAICGFSMGGGGAIRLAVKHADIFSAAAGWGSSHGSRGNPEGTAAFVTQSAGKFKPPARLYMIVGDKDFTYANHAPVVEALQAANMRFEYKILPGVGHDLGRYHSETAPSLIRFLARDFAG